MIPDNGPCGTDGMTRSSLHAEIDKLHARIKATAEGTDCVWCGLPEVNGSKGKKRVHDCGCPWGEQIIDAAMMQHDEVVSLADEVVSLADTNKILLQETRILKAERDAARSDSAMLEHALWECLRAMTDAAMLLRESQPVVASALDILIKKDADALGLEVPRMEPLDFGGKIPDDTLN